VGGGGGPPVPVGASSESSSASASASAVPSDRPTVDSLPPEAVALAGKLFNLAREGNADLLQYVDAGIPPNLTNGTGDTLLMLAAYHGHASLVGELIKRGADVDAVNVKGQAPIAGAVFKGHDEVVQTLFEAGADVDGGHPSARACAAMFKRQNLIELFESKK
jgi:ankyrin repeat protein